MRWALEGRCTCGVRLLLLTGATVRLRVATPPMSPSRMVQNRANKEEALLDSHSEACVAPGAQDWKGFPWCSISWPTFDAPKLGSPAITIEHEQGELGCQMGARGQLLGSRLDDPFACR